jgi:hypothetical protein
LDAVPVRRPVIAQDVTTVPEFLDDLLRGVVHAVFRRFLGMGAVRVTRIRSRRSPANLAEGRHPLARRQGRSQSLARKLEERGPNRPARGNAQLGKPVEPRPERRDSTPSPGPELHSSDGRDPDGLHLRKLPRQTIVEENQAARLLTCQCQSLGLAGAEVRDRPSQCRHAHRPDLDPALGRQVRNLVPRLGTGLQLAEDRFWEEHPAVELLQQVQQPQPVQVELSASAAREPRPLHAVVRPQSIISVQRRT